MAEWIARQGVESCEGWAVVSDALPDDAESCHADEPAALRRIIELERDDVAAPDSETDDEPAPDSETPAAGQASSLAVGDELEPADAGQATGTRVRGVLAIAGARTQDGRVYETLEVRTTLPTLPLALQDDSQHSMGMPSGATVVGTIDRWEMVGNVMVGWATIDTSDEGQRAAELVTNAGRFGVSIDMADLDEDYTWECRAESSESIMDPWTGEEFTPCADSVMLFPFGRVGGAAITPIAAFEQAWVELDPGDEDDDAWAQQVAAQAQADVDERDAERRARLQDRGHTIVASAGIPTVPPRAWFDQPEADEPTRLTITSDGQVYGHLAVWGECHIGLPGCTSPTPSPSGYALFHTGEIDVDAGDGRRERVACGQVTFRTTHADERLSSRNAVAHYENTGQVAADVIVTDGTHGVWVSGALRPGLTDLQLREITAAAPSGDWRWNRNGLELVSILQVNTPGYMGAHRSTARALVAAASSPDAGRVRTLQRVGYGYETSAGRQAAPARAVRELRAEVAQLTSVVALLWEHVGRDARMAHLVDVVENGTPLVTPSALVAAATGSCGCGGSCGDCSG